ncbi:MAG: pyridoxal phosphate-dependent aminotransferase, partial [Ancalomicrobiaceae bacterium]|nr:pyridoxal phosphate-dependent aminotransferase [Ancalomicrobiaceae bacterium]
RFRARIGANENGFGPSPLAVEAMRRAAGDIWKYADPENRELRERIAVRLGVRSENVIVGEGIDGLLGLTVRLTVGPGAKVVTSLGAYPTFNFHVDGFGGELVRVPYVDDREDWHALLGAARAVDAPLIYLANPDNPMGTYWPAAEIEAFVTALPERALLCLDEAYVDFMDESLMPRIDVEDSRVIRFRTFSKAYGMAGARIGYALGAAAVIAEFEKIRNHFGVNLVAQAGALASLADAGHLPRIRLAVAAARARIGEIVARHGLVAIPSATNFVAVDTGRDGGFARRLLGELIARDVFVRMPGVAPLDRTIRIGCGRDEELDVFAAELPAALEAARSI